MRGMTNTPADCANCGQPISTPRNPNRKRCPPCTTEHEATQGRAIRYRWKLAHAEQVKAQANRRRRERRATDPEWAEYQRQKVRAAVAHRNQDPAKVEARRIYAREWWRAHADAVRAGANAHNRRLRDAALAAYGNACACCGEATWEFLGIDHMNGDGAAHRIALTGSRYQGGGTVMYRWLKRNGYPAGFRVLCHNCNAARGYYGYCPHERALQVAGD